MNPPELLSMAMLVILIVSAVIIAGFVAWLASVITQQTLRDRRTTARGSDSAPPA